MAELCEGWSIGSDGAADPEPGWIAKGALNRFRPVSEGVWAVLAN